jgi:hypothetical protein
VSRVGPPLPHLQYPVGKCIPSGGKRTEEGAESVMEMASGCSPQFGCAPRVSPRSSWLSRVPRGDRRGSLESASRGQVLGVTVRAGSRMALKSIGEELVRYAWSVAIAV